MKVEKIDDVVISEAKTALHLDSHYLVKVYDTCLCSSGELTLISYMEFCEGGTLFHYIRNNLELEENVWLILFLSRLTFFNLSRTFLGS